MPRALLPFQHKLLILACWSGLALVLSPLAPLARAETSAALQVPVSPPTPPLQAMTSDTTTSELKTRDRVFGIGLGAGYVNETGNAGLLYGPSRTPSLDLRADYWFAPRLAIQLSAQNSQHGYDVFPDGSSNVNLFRALVQAKYYFPVFLNPHLIAGAGAYWRTDTIGVDSGLPTVSQTQSALGFNFGAGLELPLVGNRAFLQFEAVAHDVSFGDDYDSKFVASGIADRTGIWIVAEAAVMFTW